MHMRTILFGAVLIAAAAIIAGCDKETPPPPLLPPPLDPAVKAPAAAATAPTAATAPKPPPVPVPPPFSAGTGKAAFNGVKPMIAGKTGDAKDGRGDITNVWAKLQDKALWIYIEMNGPADKNLNYRFWINNEKKDPPTMALVEKGLGAVQVHDGGKVFARVVMSMDTTDGLFFKLPQKDLPPNLATAPRLWVGHFASMDIKANGETVIYDEIKSGTEAMAIP